MTQLRIRILRCPGVEAADKTVKLSRFFRGELTQLRIRILRLPGVETAVETVKLSRFFRGALKFYEYVYCSVPIRNIGINRSYLAAHDIVLY